MKSGTSDNRFLYIMRRGSDKILSIILCSAVFFRITHTVNQLKEKWMYNLATKGVQAVLNCFERFFPSMIPVRQTHALVSWFGTCPDFNPFMFCYKLVTYIAYNYNMSESLFIDRCKNSYWKLFWIWCHT